MKLFKQIHFHKASKKKPSENYFHHEGEKIYRKRDKEREEERY